MGNCYSADHIAEDHIHTDITCNIEEPQQKYRLGRSVIDYMGVGGVCWWPSRGQVTSIFHYLLQTVGVITIRKD